MTDEPLIALGKSLRAEYQTWLVRFVPSWPDEFRLAVRDWETLNQVDAEFARLLGYLQDCLELEAWLSAGFFPMLAGDAGFDPTVAGDFPRAAVGASLLAKGAAGGKPVYSRASSLLQESGRRVTSVTDDRDAAMRRTIPLPADSADTATITGSVTVPSPRPLAGEGAGVRAVTGSYSNLSGGNLRDLARLLQTSPAIDTGAGGDDNSLTESHSFRAETAGPESAESAWPVSTDTDFLQAGAQLRVPRVVSAITEFPEAGSGEHTMQAFSVQESGGVTQPAGTESTIIPVSEDAEGLTAADLRRLGQELSGDYTDSPAIASAAKSTSVVAWRKLLSILPLRRERFIASPATPGSAGVPADVTVGDDDLHEAIPEVVQRNIATTVTAAPDSVAATPPELHDLLEVLSQEIWREYQRFYGSE